MTYFRYQSMVSRNFQLIFFKRLRTFIILQMARTQKNKATSGHLGLLKAKLAKLRRELITPKGGGGGPGEGFDVAKTGDARIGFVGQCFCIIKVFENT